MFNASLEAAILKKSNLAPEKNNDKAQTCPEE